jgi:ribosome-associated protein
MATASAPDVQTTALLRNLITALEDKKADQLTVLHVGGVSDITDYLVLATGNSEPHLRALRIEAEKVLDAAKIKIAGMEQGGFGSGWTVVDAYQIMVHFFTAEQRGNYALEKLWKDAPEVNLTTLAPKAAPKPAKGTAAVVTKKKPVAKAKTAAKRAPKAKVAAKKPATAKTTKVAAKKKAAVKKA